MPPGERGPDETLEGRRPGPSGRMREDTPAAAPWHWACPAGSDVVDGHGTTRPAATTIGSRAAILLRKAKDPGPGHKAPSVLHVGTIGTGDTLE